MIARRRERTTVDLLEKYAFVERSIAAVGRLLFADIMDAKFMNPILLVACLDESGKLPDKAHTVSFGGCVTTQDSWDAFRKPWMSALQEYGIQYFSMKDALRLEGPFIGWDNRIAERDELFRRLTNLTKEVFRIAAPMSSSAFKTLTDTQQRKLGNDLQYCGFEVALRGILNSFPNAFLHVVCDLSEQYSEKCIRLYNQLRKDDPNFKEKCVAITFADDTRHIPLQAADLVAYCARADKLRDSIELFPIMREMIEILGAHGVETHYYAYRADGSGLGSAELET